MRSTHIAVSSVWSAHIGRDDASQRIFRHRHIRSFAQEMQLRHYKIRAPSHPLFHSQAGQTGRSDVDRAGGIERVGESSGE